MHNNCILTFLTVGRLRVTSPLTVTESDALLEVVIAVASDIFILQRELVYAVQLLDGTATGKIYECAVFL